MNEEGCRIRTCTNCEGEGHVIVEATRLTHTGDRFAFPSIEEFEVICIECGGVGLIELDS